LTGPLRLCGGDQPRGSSHVHSWATRSSSFGLAHSASLVDGGRPFQPASCSGATFGGTAAAMFLAYCALSGSPSRSIFPRLHERSRSHHLLQSPARQPSAPAMRAALTGNRLTKKGPSTGFWGQFPHDGPHRRPHPRWWLKRLPPLRPRLGFVAELRGRAWWSSPGLTAYDAAEDQGLCARGRPRRLARLRGRPAALPGTSSNLVLDAALPLFAGGGSPRLSSGGRSAFFWGGPLCDGFFLGLQAQAPRRKAGLWTAEPLLRRGRPRWSRPNVAPHAYGRTTSFKPRAPWLGPRSGGSSKGWRWRRSTRRRPLQPQRSSTSCSTARTAALSRGTA